MYAFQLDEIAHIIVNGKLGIINALQGMGLSVADDADEESIFRLVLEHKTDERLYRAMVKIINEHQYHRHCNSCIQAIMPMYEKGVAVSKAMIEEKKSSV